MASNQSRLWTAVKITLVAIAAATLFKMSRNSDDPETNVLGTRFGTTVVMWALGFAVAAVGGFVVLSSLSGVVAVLGALALAVTTIALVMGAGRDAINRSPLRQYELGLDYDVDFEVRKKPDDSMSLEEAEEYVEGIEEVDVEALDEPVDIDVDEDTEAEA